MGKVARLDESVRDRRLVADFNTLLATLYEPSRQGRTIGWRRGRRSDGVGVTVGVVLLGVTVGVTVGVFVDAPIGVCLGVLVGVTVGVFVDAPIGVCLGVLVGVSVQARTAKNPEPLALTGACVVAVWPSAVI
jgi:hypothetical protein